MVKNGVWETRYALAGLPPSELPSSDWIGATARAKARKSRSAEQLLRAQWTRGVAAGLRSHNVVVGYMAIEHYHALLQIGGKICDLSYLDPC